MTMELLIYMYLCFHRYYYFFLLIYFISQLSINLVLFVCMNSCVAACPLDKVLTSHVIKYYNSIPLSLTVTLKPLVILIVNIYMFLYISEVWQYSI